MSAFHRKQAIAEYAPHHDNHEAYGNLSKFIYNNYKQALGVIETQESVVKAMREKGLDVNKMFEWLEEERRYLESRQEKDDTDELVMDYYLKLVELKKHDEEHKKTVKRFGSFAPNERGSEAAKVEGQNT
ncbi:hypothetical protein VKT23_002719 [Stygiomarasmius scandens]|uniref:Uncharacterized protein n=1 Tax=Marasmiellus scandens TaxID=2682957 RepID=A0ABR1K5E1_9AGAR